MVNEIQLINQDGKVLVSSRVVAQDFKKRPSEVNRKIRELIEDLGCVQNCTDLFIESNYNDSQGKSQCEFLLTRDGFSLLVMGFTGKEALQWKLKYIEAFNKMEEIIKNQLPQLSHKQQLQLTILNGSDIEKVLALKEYEEVITAPLIEKIECDAPKVESYNMFMDTDGLYTVTDVAKLLQVKRDWLYTWLRENELVYKQKRVCTVKAENLGIMTMKVKNGYECLYVTPKGVEYIKNRI